MADEKKTAPAEPTAANPTPTAADTTTSTAPQKAPARDGDGERDVVGNPDAPLTPTGDIEVTKASTTDSPLAEGPVTQRYGGTLQREPTPEELPSDAKVTPLAEQVNPNSAAQAVGAAPQPEEIAGVEQPKEGEKNVLPDTSDASAFLSETSEQGEEAVRAAEDAARDADRGRY